MVLTFSINDMVTFLQSHGFQVEQVKVEMQRRVYHDDMETYHLMAWTVKTREDKDFCRPIGDEFSADAWLEAAFSELFKRKILHVAMGGY